MTIREELYSEYVVKAGEIFDEFVKEYTKITECSFILQNEAVSESEFEVENTPVLSDNNEEDRSVAKLLINSKVYDKDRSILKSNNYFTSTDKNQLHCSSPSKNNGFVSRVQRAMTKPMIETCTIDETFINEMTYIQDQSLFMNESIVYGLNESGRRRRAKRRIGKRFEKRKLGIVDLYHENIKRIKIDNEPNYLFEYLKSQTVNKKKNRSLSASEHIETEKMRKELEATKKEIEELKKCFAEMQQIKKNDICKSKLVDGVVEIKVEEIAKDDNSRTLNTAEHLIKNEVENRFECPKENTDKSGSDALKTSKDRSVIERKIKKIGADKFYNVLIKPPTAIESSICMTAPIKPISNIKDVFKKSKAEFVDKVNKTLLKNNKIDDISNNSDKENQNSIYNSNEISKPVFNSNSHKPRLGLNVAHIKGHSLYKQSIDIQSMQQEPKLYVPKCNIPFYSGEDEFESDEKKFEPAFFTKDPKLLYIVRKQNHDDIRKFFGDQKDINVKLIFDKIENVSNDSPNKLRRNS